MSADGKSGAGRAPAFLGAHTYRVKAMDPRDDARVAQRDVLGAATPETREAALADLVVVAEFRDIEPTV